MINQEQLDKAMAELRDKFEELEENLGNYYNWAYNKGFDAALAQCKKLLTRN